MPPPTTRTSNVRGGESHRDRAIIECATAALLRIVSAWRRSTRFAAYWERHIHDLEITRHPVGSRGFFDDLDQYHFEKLHHLLRLVDFDGYRGQSVLEVGCGAGVDLARFAKGGAIVTGVDLAASAIELASANFAQQGLDGRLRGRRRRASAVCRQHASISSTPTASCSTPPNPQRLVDECRRVLKPGGEAVFQVYNRISWLNALSKLMKVGLEHDDAPVLLKFSIGEFRRLLSRISRACGSCPSAFR